MIGTEFVIEAHFQIWLVVPRRRREDIKVAISSSARAQGCMDRDTRNISLAAAGSSGSSSRA